MGGLQLVKSVGGRLAVDAEALGDVLMCKAVHRIVARLAQQERRDARGGALEDSVFELSLGFEHAPAEGFEYAARNLGLTDEKAVEHLAVHHDDGRVLGHLREGVVHALTDAGHLAEETLWEKMRDDELSPLGRHAINLHRARAQEKERLARLTRRVENRAAREGARRGHTLDLAQFLLSHPLKKVGTAVLVRSHAHKIRPRHSLSC